MTDSIRHAGRWTLEDRFASPWHYLPVEVPPGTGALRVELEYERADGTVLDLGCFGPGGFRGWSGGARESFVIARDAATPGYLPGELEAGAWLVAIGVHRVPPDGVGYRVTATMNSSLSPSLGLPPPPLAPPSPADRPPRRALPARPGRRWLPGALHTHTVHADGKLTVPELAVLAARRGLDFLAVTDHNTVSHHAELAAAARRYGIILLPGQELTTDGGHAGALGDVGWIDFREEPDAWLDATEAGGGPLSVNHPFPRAGGGAPRSRPPRVRRAVVRPPPGAPPPAAARGLALELARPALDPAAVLVAGLESRGDPGRGQRLAPGGCGRPAGAPDHLGRVRRRPAG